MVEGQEDSICDCDNAPNQYNVVDTTNDDNDDVTELITKFPYSSVSDNDEIIGQELSKTIKTTTTTMDEKDDNHVIINHTTTNGTAALKIDDVNEMSTKQIEKTINESLTSKLLFWQDDDWTNNDCTIIQQVLDNNATICRIDTTILQNDKQYKYRGKFITDTIAWDRFYTYHKNNFFKDRHYIQNDFPNEFFCINNNDNNNNNNDYNCLVEIGCGVGNTILPLLEDNDVDDDENDDDYYYDNETETITFKVKPSSAASSTTEKVPEPTKIEVKRKKWNMIGGIDLSTVAINILKNDERYKKTQQQPHEQQQDQETTSHTTSDDDNDNNVISVLKEQQRQQQQQQQQQQNNNTICYVTVCDISKDNVTIPKQLCNVATVVTLFFTLSAIHPYLHNNVIQNIIQTILHPMYGGIILFRDYGRYDHAQLKLGSQPNKLIPISSSSTTTQLSSSILSSSNDNINIDSKLRQQKVSTTNNTVPCEGTVLDVSEYNQKKDGALVEDDDDADTTSENYSHYYRKHDGTKCYYFTIEDIIYLFSTIGQCEIIECNYIHRIYTNRLQNTHRRRVWVKGRFRFTPNLQRPN